MINLPQQVLKDNRSNLSSLFLHSYHVQVLNSIQNSIRDVYFSDFLENKIHEINWQMFITQ